MSYATHFDQSMHIPISIKAYDRERIVETKALIDSGAIGTFVNKDFVKKKQLSITPIKPRKVFNVNETENKGEQISAITSLVQLLGKF